MDPFVLLARMEQDGPPEYQAQAHSCSKMKYATLGNVPASRGVNLAATGAKTAGAIYMAGVAVARHR